MDQVSDYKPSLILQAQKHLGGLPSAGHHPYEHAVASLGGFLLIASQSLGPL